VQTLCKPVRCRWLRGSAVETGFDQRERAVLQPRRPSRVDARAYRRSSSGGCLSAAPAPVSVWD